MATGSSKGKNTKRNTRSTGASSKRKQPVKSSARSKQQNMIRDEIIVVLIIVVFAILLLSEFKIMGSFGQIIGNGMFGLFGMVGYIVPFVFLALSLYCYSKRGTNVSAIKGFCGFVILWMLCVFAQAIFGDNNTTYPISYYYTVNANDHKNGGFLGGIFVRVLGSSIGMAGTIIISIALVIVAGVILTEKSFIQGVKNGSEVFIHNVKDDSASRRQYREMNAQMRQMEREERMEENRFRKQQLQERHDEKKARAEEKIVADMEARKKRVEEARLKREEELKRLKEAQVGVSLSNAALVRVRVEDIPEITYTEEADASENVIADSEKGKEYVQAYSESVNHEYDDVDAKTCEADETAAPQEEPERTFQFFSTKRNTPEPLQADSPKSAFMDSTNLSKRGYTTDVHEITSQFSGDFDLESLGIHTEHKINVAPPEEIMQEAYERDIYVDDTSNFSEHYMDVSQIHEAKVHQTEAGKIAEPIPAIVFDDKQTEYDDVDAKTNEISAETKKPVVVEEKKKKSKKYQFPPITCLDPVRRNTSSDATEELRATSEKLQKTLADFGVKATVIGASRGPAVTRYELQPETGVKVSRIVSLTDDLKLALAAADIRMEAPIPGKSAIGIEVPNAENTMVQFRELLESKTFTDAKSKISFAVGKDLAGQVVVSDIAKMPHVLIAGATGSGKSVCINTLIMSILYKATPDEVKLIMVDPKVVELSVYNDIPHLLIPVVTDPKKAAAALNWGVQEMTVRYQRFAEMGVRDIFGYNKKLETNPENVDLSIHTKMPQIVIIVDELADLMMVAAKEVEEHICRLAQLARAAGIHLVLATQRPSVDVITGLIKANMPSRVAFSVSSGVDSRTILDMTGAEKLLGKGDMLFYPQGYTKPARVQGAFVSDDEVSKVVSFIKNNNGGSCFDESVLSKVEATDTTQAAAGGGVVTPDSGLDPLFYEAGHTVIEKDKASIGLLQRIHKIGFNRAARIMDQLADAGVVSGEEGTKARTILMTMDEFEAYMSSLRSGVNE